MLLFIVFGGMLFGSFFTAYFFIRVVGSDPWPLPPFHLPVFVAGINTAILVSSSFTMHWALHSIKRGNRAGLQAGLVLTFFWASTFLLTQINEYSRRVRAARRRLGVGLLLPHGTARAHVFIGLTILLAIMTIARLPRTLLAGAPSRGRDRPGSTGTSSTSCGSSSSRRSTSSRAMRNPLRSEAEAYRFLLGTIVYFGLIVLAAVVGGTWWGVGVFAVLTALALVWFFQRDSLPPAPKTGPRQESAEDETRILVVANETVGGRSCAS